MFFSSLFFPVDPENHICFLDKLIIIFSFNFKVNFSLFNTEETESLIIRTITCKKEKYPWYEQKFSEKKKTGEVKLGKDRLV